MFDKELIKTFKYEDLEGKLLEMHYGYNEGCYCLIGWDKEADIKYVLALENR